MIVAIDVGNSLTKAWLLENHKKIDFVSIPTNHLWTPRAWTNFFRELTDKNPLYKSSPQRISCVNWKAYLALRVALGYDLLEEFDPNKEFTLDLIDLGSDSPFVFENAIPLDTSQVEGLVGTDRLLASYAALSLYRRSLVIVSLGTATTIDYVSKEGQFFSGMIIPGIDTAYQGLISKASHLPNIDQLQPTGDLFGKNVLESLGNGAIVSQACIIESFYQKITQTYGDTALILTGGRAATLAPFLTQPHDICDYLVAYGLSIIK